jgi:hypothetical protein
MDAFFHFIESHSGRALRMFIGVIMIVLGVVVIPGVPGYIIALAGLEPLFAGLAGVCLLAPAFGYTLDGEKVPDATAW